MQYHDGNRSEPYNQRELSDHGAAVEAKEWEMDCKRIVSFIDWGDLVRNLDDDERRLFDLSYRNENSIPEIANLLGKDKEEVARELNKLQTKIRYRIRVQVHRKPRVEEALNKLGFLSPKTVREKNKKAVKKKKKATKKKPRASAQRATAKLKAASAGRAKETRLENVLKKLGFRLAK